MSDVAKARPVWETMDQLDIRLAQDGIREAICELRFSTNFSRERVIGRLLDYPTWRSSEPVRLPTADIPAELRAQDASLRFQPSYQIGLEGACGFMRIGSDSVSVHRLTPYPGWAVFGAEVHALTASLFSNQFSPTLERIGLRYVNAFNQSEHFIAGSDDLNLNIAADGQPVSDDFVLSFSKMIELEHRVQLTLSTPRYVQAPDGLPFDMLIDVDVSTEVGQVPQSSEAVKKWIETAHRLLKQEFFRLIPATVIDRLRG